MERHEINLWQRRLFEAQAGLVRWLVDCHEGEGFESWLDAQREIFGDHAGDNADPDHWRSVFFRAQAIMEAFVISRYGEEELAAWTEASGEVHGRTAPSYGPGATGVVRRLAAQADGYASVYSIEAESPSHASMTIGHCGIWDYRERARSRGVPLVLDSPCTYCTQLIRSNAQAKGCEASVSLTENSKGHGCHWELLGPIQDMSDTD